jgi:hypothetical protein
VASGAALDVPGTAITAAQASSPTSTGMASASGFMSGFGLVRIGAW